MPHNSELSELDSFIQSRIACDSFTKRDQMKSNRKSRSISLIERLLSSLTFRKRPEPRLIVCRLCDRSVNESMFEEHTNDCSRQQDLLNDQNMTDHHLQTLCTVVEQDDSELYKIARSALIASGQSDTVILALAKLNYKLTKLQLQFGEQPQQDGRNKNIERLIFLLKHKQDIYKQLNQKNHSDGNNAKKTGKATVFLSMVLKSLKRTPTDNPIVYTVPSIHDFDIVTPLSRGAFGSVYLCRHKKSKDLFSIKAIRKVDSHRKNTIAHALTERRALTLINSPWIVPLYFAFQSEHHLFLVMEYMCGGDLGALLKVHRRISNLESVRFYAAELVIAVDQLHRANIIHHDIKPENILIGADGHIKLIDLGLSRKTTDGSRAEARIGTPDYMAPELTIGEASSTSVDVWAIGCVIHELYYGQPPFHADTVERVFTNIQSGYKSKSEEPIDMLISSLLNSDPMKRPTLEEVKDDPFFNGILWSNRPEGLLSLRPPFIPKPEHDEDTCYFDICRSPDQLERLSVIEEMQAAYPLSMHSFNNDHHQNDIQHSSHNSPARSSYSEMLSTASMSGNSSNASLATQSPHDFAYKNVDLLEALNRRAIMGRSSGNSSPLRRSAAAFN